MIAPAESVMVLQEAQALRRQVAIKDKEAAERATLVTQDKLQRYTNRQPHRLQDVWIQPAISSKRKVPGNLDAHYNGFRCILINSSHISNLQHSMTVCTRKEFVLRHVLSCKKANVIRRKWLCNKVCT